MTMEYGRLARTDAEGVAIFVLELTEADGGLLLERLKADASPARIERASRFRFEIDAVRCLAAEALLRHALRERHGIAVGDIVLALGPQGKPFLPGRLDIHFNLSHSGAWVLCALHDRPVGIDVEVARAMADPPARQFMSPAELASYHALPPAEQPAWFFRVWTLKESVLKAAGTGLSFDPRRMTVRMSRAAMEAEGAPEAPTGTRWRPHVLPMPEGVHAAACTLSPLG
jgi:4'-phosphopantetheinyl transferase